MSDESGKWLPYDSDGGKHDCRMKNGKDLMVEACFINYTFLGKIIQINLAFGIEHLKRR